MLRLRCHFLARRQNECRRALHAWLDVHAGIMACPFGKTVDGLEMQFGTKQRGGRAAVAGVDQGAHIHVAHGDQAIEQRIYPLVGLQLLQPFHIGERGRQRAVRSFVAVAYPIAAGTVAIYYPEGNCLVGLDSFDPESGTSTYKSVPVSLRRSRVKALPADA